MWSRHRGPLSIAGQLLVLQLAVVAIVLAVVGVISVRQSTKAFEEQRGSQLRSVAEYLANVPVVRSQIGQEGAARSLAPPVALALALSAADDVAVVDVDGLVLSSSDPTLNGSEAVLGESRVIEGRGWSGDVVVDGQRVLVGHAPVLDLDGTLVGIAVAEAEYPSIRERLSLAAPNLLLYLGLGAMLGLTGSYLLSRLVKRRTRGLGASEIATLADHREALLYSIREGVIAVGLDGRVSMANDSARELLRLDTDAVGRPVESLGLDSQVEDLLLSSGEAHDLVAVVGSRVLVFNQRAAASRGEGIGTVTTLRDRTELVAVQSQLSSNLSITDTLRAQTHEFANQLHTISGLVQLKEYDEVVTLIGELSHRRGELSDFVSHRVEDPSVAALVIAKASVADEAGVRLSLTDSSRLPPLPTEASADLISVIGNLMDNAVDACREEADPVVCLDLCVEGGEILVEVGDNGPGVPTELREQIFARGFSTKGPVPGGRGVGLPLVKLISGRRGGAVTVAREADRTVFRVRLPLSEVSL